MDTLFPLLKPKDRTVLPVLPTLSQEDVSTIWELTSDFIKQQYSLSKGVQIPDLGLFTFVRQRLEIGNSKFIIAKRPLFFLLEKLVQKHGLKQNKIYVPGDIPVVSLNFVTVSLQSPFSKDVVEGCVRETLQLLARAVSRQTHVQFTFKGIGVLTIKDSKVKMRFFRDFLYGVDSSGSVAQALANRPYTADSVISVTETTLPRPISVLSFPRTDMKETERKLPMETIVEEGEGSRPKTAVATGKADKEGDGVMHSPKKTQDKVTPTSKDSASCKSEQKDTEAHEAEEGRVLSADCLKKKKPKCPTLPSCENHEKAGQELCYVCLQRAQRNIPVYNREEEKKKEMDEELALHQCLIWKERKSILKERMKCLADRQQSQKNAAFNLGVAEAIRMHKNQKPEFSNTFLFDKRPDSTCINIAKRKEHTQILLQQIKIKQEKALKEKQNNEMLEKIERQQIRDQAIAQREKFLKDKIEERLSLKRELDAQVKNDKPFRLPAWVEDSQEPIFGKDDGCVLLLSHQNELECRKQQLKQCASDQRRRILHGLMDQQRELEALQKIRKEFQEERSAEAERMRCINDELLEHWMQCTQEKRKREEEQKAFDRAVDKLFILDKCERYPRCKQCQRSVSNDGKTNTWPFSKFLTGSRVYM